MARERRDRAQDRRDDAALLARRAKAPNTVKLEGLLWAFAEKHATATYERIAFIAAGVTDWANSGQEVDVVSTLAVIEAAMKEAGVRL